MFRKMCAIFIALAFVAIAWGTLMAQAPTVSITIAIKKDLGNNQCLYRVSGKANNVGNNYHVDLENLDSQGGLIETKQVVVTNGSGKWSKTWTGPCGAVSVTACLVDDIGRKVSACDAAYNKKYSTPSLTQWGMIILVALIIVAGVYLLMRRKPVTA